MPTLRTIENVQLPMLGIESIEDLTAHTVLMPC